MASRLILRWAALAPTLVFAIAAAWEFVLEDAVLRGLGYGPESSSEHWRYVLIATAAAGLACSITAAPFLRASIGRKGIEQALRESEARLRAIIDHAPANISLKDSEARYVLVNRRHVEQYGATNDRVRGKRTREVFPRFSRTSARSKPNTSGPPRTAFRPSTSSNFRYPMAPAG